MIDSFVAWSRRNPARAKKLDDFVDDALIAVGKRCKSCLSQTLGITFAGSGGEEGSPIDLRGPAPATGKIPAHGDAQQRVPDVAPSWTPTHSPEPATPETTADFGEPLGEDLGEMQDLTEETPLDLPERDEEFARTEADMIRRAEEEARAPSETADSIYPEAPDISSMGVPPSTEPRHVEETREKRPRDFLSDFELIEPTPMVVEPTKPEEESRPTPPPDIVFEIPKVPEHIEAPLEAGLPKALGALEDSFSAHGVDITLPKKTDEGPSEVTEPLETTDIGLTWDEYERVLTRSPSPEGATTVPSRPGDERQQPQQPVTESPSADISRSTAESPTIWSPYDEPIEPETESTPEDSMKSDTVHEDDTMAAPKEDVSKTPPRFTRPPPPPPPPESEESEEERKRRARRLFFGT